MGALEAVIGMLLFVWARLMFSRWCRYTGQCSRLRWPIGRVDARGIRCGPHWQTL